MIIGIDANEANVCQRVGSNEYAYKVLQQLYRQGKAHDWIIYLSADPVADLPKPKINWRYRVIKPGFFWTQWRLPLDLFCRRRPDVFLTLGHYAPRFCPIPTMICVMDLAFLKFPGSFLKRDLLKLKTWTEYSVKKADHIFTISRATKKDVMANYGIGADKISVAYPGVDRLNLADKSPIKGRYILYVGTLQPRKNIDALIEAAKGTRLVIAGKTGWKYRIKPAAGVKFLGYVPPEKLGRLIKDSQGLVLPSLYEGFGIPVVQAMSLGVTVLVSRNSSLPEIVGDCGLYIEPPFNAAAVNAGINRLLSLSPIQKQALVNSARNRARQFSWENAGRIILKALGSLGHNN